MRSVEMRAFAKVNLDLRLERRRPDGYHDIRTIFQSIALHDRLRLEARPQGLEVRADDPAVPEGAGNLAYRAAWMLRAPARRGARIAIRKRIPAAAGFGGGSSDAAATLFGLARLWGLDLDEAARFRAARRLGADVPYFLTGGRALGLGRGDEIYPMTDPPRLWLVALVPPFGHATAEVYRRAGRGLTASRRAGTMWSSVFAGATVPYEGVRNDLERGVGARGPIIAAMKRALVRAGASTALMAGSGSAVFGTFPARPPAAAARRALAGGPWRTLLTHTISRREYLGRMWVGAT